MTVTLVDVFAGTLKMIRSAPQNLVERMLTQQAADASAPTANDIEAAIVKGIEAGPASEWRDIMHPVLAAWDQQAADAAWCASTPASSDARREKIYSLLAFGDSLRETCSKHMPVYKQAVEVIIDANREFNDWYSKQAKGPRFYWDSVAQHLRDVRNYPVGAVAAIDRASDEVVERLSNPAASEPTQVRGLVVGYVQSGKTTNFTAVVAKAIDAGYKLIVVLSGTTNMLRGQTQRRIDMDLVGVQNIDPNGDGQHDYAQDRDWPKKFIKHPADPRKVSKPRIVRLTGRDDFEKLAAGITALNFEKQQKNEPLYRLENLAHADVRLVVVKKITDRMRKLIKDLGRVGKNDCMEVPALVIDDESDQASVNTVNPAKKGVGDRTGINQCIVDLLATLPRAQYIGYTATPFANVLINPNDVKDVYPKDFIISLPRPNGYMGALDFHDIQGVPVGRMSNEEAHVRKVTGSSPDNIAGDEDALGKVLDSYLVAGAIKLFRESSSLRYPHHTMLYHVSPRMAQHAAAAATLRKLWKRAEYDSPAAVQRLWYWMQSEFVQIWRDRGKAHGSIPTTLQSFKNALGKALDRMRQQGSTPIIVVNSDKDATVPDFETSDVWKIIVGGSKLSRGYTVEGLTVSYFGRKAQAQDSLMQMGRWFGYRQGYADLIRVYVDSGDPKRAGYFDLYDAFECMCRDEEDFRAQLERYRRSPDGTTLLTPLDVPALVYNSHPKLRPTAKNKMYHAEVKSIGFTEREPTRPAIDKAGRKKSAEAFGQLVSSLTLQEAEITAGGKSVRLLWGLCSHDNMVKALSGTRWQTDSNLGPELAFLTQKENKMDEWAVLIPLLKGKGVGASWRLGNHEIPSQERGVVGSRFKVFSAPPVPDICKAIAGLKEANVVFPFKIRERMGAIALYPTRIMGNKAEAGLDPVIGFTMAVTKLKTTKVQIVGLR
jgi:hypothetical protein